MVEVITEQLNLVVRNLVHFISLWNELMELAVGVFVRSPLPGLMLRQKVELHTERLRDFRVRSKLLSPVEGCGLNPFYGK